MRSREAFGEEICPVVRAAAPLDVEMPEFNLFACKVVPHVDALGLVQFACPVCDGLRDGVVCDYARGGLGVSTILLLD